MILMPIVQPLPWWSPILFLTPVIAIFLGALSRQRSQSPPSTKKLWSRSRYYGGGRTLAPSDRSSW
jgi:hypothetical protein